MTDPTHEYRATLTIPLHGSNRHMSAAVSAAGPILDKALADIAALTQVTSLGVTPTIEDTTVRLGKRKSATIEATTEANPAVVEPIPEPLVEPVAELADASRHRPHRNAAE